MHCKSLLLSTLAIAAFAASATPGSAGTLLTPGGPAYDWSGPYVGLHLGYMEDHSNYSSNFGGLGAGPSGSIHLGGVFGGAQGGYNFQIPSFPIVFGPEVDFSGADVTGHTIPDPASAFPSHLHADIDWTSTVRGRVGYAWDEFLFYGTGGLAIVHANATDTNIGFGFNNGSGDATFYGWVAGAGAEVALMQNVTAKVEFQHIDVGHENITFGPSPLVAPVDGRINRFEVGVNYKF